MSLVTLFNKSYSINETLLNLKKFDISLLPAEIGNLINLKELLLNHNQLSLLPADTEGASIHL